MNGSATSTAVSSSGISRVSSTCSPLRSESRSSIRVCAASIRPVGAAPGAGANVLTAARAR